MFEPAGQPVPLAGLLNGRLSLTLFRDETGWFRSGRTRRILFEAERDPDLMPIQARGTFRAAESGRYLLEVSSLLGRARRIAPTGFELNLAGERRRALSLNAVANGVSEPSLTRRRVGRHRRRATATR